MAKPKTTDEMRRELAESEYVHAYITTSDLNAARTSYRKTMGDLKAVPPDGVERKAIELRSQSLAILDPKIRGIKRQEWLEFELLHSQVRRMLLKDDIADTGIPDQITLSVMKDMSPNELDVAVDALKKLQEMRRNILTS